VIAWGAVEQAVRAWVLAAVTPAPLSLPAASVYFADQAVPVDQNAARVVISVDGPFMVGVDGNTWNYNAARPAGQEIELTTRGNRELVVKLQAFAPVTVGTGVTARALLAAAQAYLSVDSVRYALNQAGLGVLIPGDVLRLPRVVSGTHEDRAALDSRFSVRQEVTERTGYFDTVVLSGTVDEQ